MKDTRRVYLDSYRSLAPLAAAPELADRWESESCLANFSVRGLAGHLIARTGWAVIDYLDADLPADPTPVDAAAYYATVLQRMDAAENEQVRVRGEEAAPDGPAGLLERYEDALEALSRLENEPDDRAVRVYGGIVMTLDDYLVTRICEILIHADDLALSLGIDPPGFPQAAWDLALEHLLAVARLTHGDRAALMGFSRRERDAVEALRVF